jgi:hypothetical protein
MKTETEPVTHASWDMVKIRSRMRRINEMLAFNTRRMIEFPSIDGNAQRRGEIEKLKAEFQGLKWKLGEIQFERGAE